MRFSTDLAFASGSMYMRRSQPNPFALEARAMLWPVRITGISGTLLKPSLYCGSLFDPGPVHSCRSTNKQAVRMNHWLVSIVVWLHLSNHGLVTMDSFHPTCNYTPNYTKAIALKLESAVTNNAIQRLQVSLFWCKTPKTVIVQAQNA